jgi:hypothetical protein
MIRKVNIIIIIFSLNFRQAFFLLLLSQNRHGNCTDKKEKQAKIFRAEKGFKI